MIQILQRLLPAIIPSWRFFDVIAPSPRLQYTLLTNESEVPSTWHEFRPRPVRISFLQMLGRMLWNPQWNEALFIVSCAERLLEQYTPHSEDEILKRIEADLKGLGVSGANERYLQFRLLLVRREGSQLQQEPAFMSRLKPLSGHNIQADAV